MIPKISFIYSRYYDLILEKLYKLENKGKNYPSKDIVKDYLKSK